MTTPVNQISRDGLDKLVKLGKTMCKAVLLFTPVLLKKYPDSTLIQDLLAAIGVVCALLPEVENEFLQPAGTNEDVLADPTGIPGINPSLAPAAGGDIS